MKPIASVWTLAIAVCIWGCAGDGEPGQPHMPGTPEPVGMGGGAAGVGGSHAGTGGGAPGSSTGCDASTQLLALPADPGERGPWKVGVRTVKIGRLTVEVVYPALPGSTDGMPPVTYDLRDWLPPSEFSKIPDEASPAVQPLGGDLYRDVPIDSGHGPYPAVLHIHGTASIRIASGSTLVHWASHGFVVLAADHPGLMLQDQLAIGCGFSQTGEQDLLADVQAEIASLQNPSGDLAFLGTSVDASRLAINGHSQGGCIAATMSTLPGVQMVIPFAGSTATVASDSLTSIMYVGGIADEVIGFPAGALLYGNFVCPTGSISSTDAYHASPGPPAVTKRLVGITHGGHLATTDLCQNNDLGKTALEEMVERGVCGVGRAAVVGIAALFDCGPEGNTVMFDESLPPIHYVTTAALEEALLCQDRSAAFAAFTGRYPAVGVFETAR